jgi:branched-chain amino acid aminotransferase
MDGAPPVPADAPDARLSVLDRGVLYGDGAFEVLRTWGGAPFRLDDHLARLGRACGALRFAVPVPLRQLAAEVRATHAATDHAESHLRIVLTRGEGGAGPRIAGLACARRFIVAAPLALPSDDDYARGGRVALVGGGAMRDPFGSGGHKTLAYLRSVAALAEAQARGADDALLVTESGDVLEGATSAVVVARGDVLRSPPASAGLLASITWDTVAMIARAEGFRVEARMLSPRDVYDADEVLLLSAVRGVMAVVVADGVRIGAGVPGPIALRLRASLARHAVSVAQAARLG